MGNLDDQKIIKSVCCFIFSFQYFRGKFWDLVAIKVYPLERVSCIKYKTVTKLLNKSNNFSCCFFKNRILKTVVSLQTLKKMCETPVGLNRLFNPYIVLNGRF